MSEVKVFQLAKDLGVTLGDLQAVMKQLGVTVDEATGSLDSASADTVREIITQDRGIIKQAKTVEIPQALTVRELAEKVSMQTADIQKRLVELGILASVNQSIGADVAAKVMEKWGYHVTVITTKETKEIRAPKSSVAQPKSKHAGKLQPRPPVITVMGHVDHGKTTLLDAIRKTNVTESEFGGITQHIGAYQVEWNGKKITFLDTPGHAAFTAMRARGASVTDVAVLVVAADDSVMPQTIEAIDHAKAAEVPIIVAINKVDKPEADVERTMQQLAEHNVVPEEWGGDTIMVKVSAKMGDGIDELLEMILLVAEMADLHAEVSTTRVSGNVIEAQVDRGGSMATVLIERGTLKIGTPVVAGETYGKVKAMFDYKGERITKAGPATPVAILGLSSAPAAGDKLESAKDEREARSIAEKRATESRRVRMGSESKITLEDLYRQIKEGAVKKLGIVLKADVQGSEEAVRQSLVKITHDEVRVDIIHSGVGNINESDVMLASAANAIVLGFNVKIDPQSARMAEAEHVEVRTYNVIYELTKDVKAAMGGLLEPVFEEQELGWAEVRAMFKIPNGGVVAGCYVKEGRVVRGEFVRVRRDKDVVYEGKLDSLKHLKDEARDMAQGFECGIQLQGFTDFQIGDVIECYAKKQIARAI